MTTNNPDPSNLPDPDRDWQNATARRLGKLQTMPVDMSNLEAKINAAIPRTQRGVLRRMTMFPLARAIAAGFILVLISLGLLFAFSGGQAVASAQDFARLHDDMVSGRIHAAHVTTIDAANKALAAQDSNSPQLPEVPSEHVMACCMNSVKGKRVACVLIDQGGIPVTMTVASAGDMKSPDSPTVQRNGITYHVHSGDKLNMVMTSRNDRWICLIGQLPTDRLMDLAGQLQF